MIRTLLSIFLLAIVSGCANQTSPTGGPADKTPPELIDSNPANNQKNFQGKTVELTFNENIKLKSPTEEILISPSTGKKTKFTAKGKKLIIEPELPWQENTTYSLSFREGVQDITEGNPAENLQLAFSTGPTIDSASLSGSVRDLFTDKSTEKITVAIYDQDTFDIFQHAPAYFTFTDKKGNFQLRNLKRQSYRIYAFEDKNKNLKVESKSERFGFISKTVSTNDTTAIEVGLIKVDARPIKITSIRHTPNLTTIRFNKEMSVIKTHGLSKEFLSHYSTKTDEFLIHHLLTPSDSLQIKISASDSTATNYDSLIYIKGSLQKNIDEQFKLTTAKSNYAVRTKTQHYTFKTSKLISAMNLDSMYILYDTLNRTTLTRKNISYDTTNNLLFISTPVIDSLITKQTGLIMAKASLISITGDTIKRSSSAVKILKPEDTGSLEIFVATQQPSYIIQLIKEDGQLITELKNPKQHVFEYLEPTTYKLRIILDTNANGKWDAGNFYKNEEPEPILYYKNSEKQTAIPTRANWEVGPLSITF